MVQDNEHRSHHICRRLIVEWLIDKAGRTYTTGRMHTAKVERKTARTPGRHIDHRWTAGISGCQKSRISHTRLLWWSWNLVGRRPKRTLSITPFDTLTLASSMTELPLVADRRKGRFVPVQLVEVRCRRVALAAAE